jgi:hypothetical protein
MKRAVAIEAFFSVCKSSSLRKNSEGAPLAGLRKNSEGARLAGTCRPILDNSHRHQTEWPNEN